MTIAAINNGLLVTNHKFQMATQRDIPMAWTENNRKN